ncbi:MAG: hypothetical protein WBN31_09550 [Gammaproteobacteria bacterium]
MAKRSSAQAMLKEHVACAASIALLLAACVSDRVPGPYVSASEAHAILDFRPPPPGSDLTPAILLAIDNVIGPASQNRASYWVRPGEHEIKVGGEALATEKVGLPPRRNFPWNANMTFEAGKRYFIAIRWRSNKRNDWEPYIWKVEDLTD